MFHVTHIHTPESCPGEDVQRARETFGKLLGSAEKIGVKILGAYVDAPAHTVYIIIEADSNEKISEFFRPTLTIARAEIRPVEDAFILAKRVMG